MCLVSFMFGCFKWVVKESIIILKNPSKMSRHQCVELTVEERKKICEVHLQNPILARSQLVELMVRYHGYRLVD